MESWVDRHICTDICTHLIKEWDQKRGDRDMHIGLHWVHKFVFNYAQGLEFMWGVRWTCTHVLMYIHILNKVWDQMRGDRHTHGAIFRHTCLCTIMQRGGVKWTYIHLLRHVNTLTKVWDQRKGNWDMHTGPHKYAKRVEQMRGIRLTCRHVLMYVNITKQG